LDADILVSILDPIFSCLIDLSAMPLFETTPVDVDEVTRLVKKHWNVELGSNIKASQNQTFQGEMEIGCSKENVVVRVTPNPSGNRTDAIELELSVLKFLVEKSLPVCSAYPDLVSGSLQVTLGELSVSVFHYAVGEPVVFTDWKWMVDEEKVIGVGKFIGRLHFLLDKFEDLHPELSSKARYWRDLHSGVLKDVVVHKDDEETSRSPVGKPRPYGIIHGDINPSNYFWDQVQGMPSMFDWDQMQRSWRLYDLSSCIWTVITLESAGSPIDLSPVPQANVKQYTEWLLKGYESETGHATDRVALDRMVAIRRELYRVFCAGALKELPPGSFMYNFCSFMNNWLSGPEQKTNLTPPATN
jgi:Ser/Thr protein kinase RdoA (MazF antagonist)